MQNRLHDVLFSCHLEDFEKHLLSTLKIHPVGKKWMPVGPSDRLDHTVISQQHLGKSFFQPFSHNHRSGTITLNERTLILEIHPFSTEPWLWELREATCIEFKQKHFVGSNISISILRPSCDVVRLCGLLCFVWGLVGEPLWELPWCSLW